MSAPTPPPADPPTLQTLSPTPEPDRPFQWAVAASYIHHTEAHVARIRLESVGINRCRDNECLPANCWYYANATGDIKLTVPEHDLREAIESLKPDKAPPAVDLSPDLPDGLVPRCPICRST